MFDFNRFVSDLKTGGYARFIATEIVEPRKSMNFY